MIYSSFGAANLRHPRSSQEQATIQGLLQFRDCQRKPCADLWSWAHPRGGQRRLGGRM